MITEMVTTGIEATKAMFGQPPRVYGLAPDDFDRFCQEQQLKPANGTVQWNGLVIRSRQCNGLSMHNSREWNRVKGDSK